MLIVDDEAINIKILAEILKDWDLKIAKDGKTALSIAKNNSPDIILLDIMMPGLDGYEVCKRLKGSSATQNIPVIFITAKDSEEDEVHGLKLGAIDYITKPFSRALVKTKVRNHLQYQQTKKELQETKKMLNKILDLSSEGIRYIDTDYNTIKSNDKYDELNRLYLKGQDKENLKDSDFKCYYSLCTRSCDSQECSLVQILNGKEFIQNDVQLSLAGEERYFIVTVVPYRNDQGELKGILQSYRDITKRKEKEIEIEKKNLELAKLYNDLETEFEKGIELHQQFLPDELPAVEGLSYAAYFQPADKLGGDFYNAIKLGEQLLVYLADVSGHGLDGSMLNIFLRETINNYLLYEHDEDRILSPVKIISYVATRYNEEDFPGDYFICLLLGVLDIKEQEFIFANAGIQVPPIIISKDGELSSLSCCGLPISSAIYKEVYRELGISDCQQKVDLTGNTIFLTTDGLIEEVVAEERYGEESLKRVLVRNHDLSPEQIVDKVNQDFKEFTGSLVGQDDITFFVLRDEEIE
ncbi:response regulator [Fuchsiella alkaliacetigena]|uniref:response regulator n=1 Tax=Fuchsiella alkaliacetigena TaxID=957042 RepID=UPI00200A29EC|nr:response regulator [Fuchsiella alkaliacetigena]MCK8824051.1 response regulator [Fuchsiella alkaliacetigena]